MQETSKASAKVSFYDRPPPGWLTPMLLGAVIVLSVWILSDMKKVYTEVRVLQEHVQETTNVLVRKGIKEP